MNRPIQILVPVQNDLLEAVVGGIIQNHNPNHDEEGRFAPAPGGATPTSISGEKQFRKLKSTWAKINNKLLDELDTPNSSKAKELTEELKGLTKEMHRVNPGSWIEHGVDAKDMVVVGGGPAGLATSIMGGADGMNTVFIESNPRKDSGGQAKHSSRIENYPGFPIGVTGRELTSKAREQAERLGAEGKYNVKITKLEYEPETGIKTLTMSDGEKIKARSVVIAAGLQFRKADFPGADSKKTVYGDGEKLAEITKDKPAVVIGGSNGAAQAALGVAKTASHVYLISRSKIENSMSDYQVEALQNHPKVTVLQGEEASKFVADQNYLTTKHGKNIPAAGVGIFIGSVADTSWLPKGIEKHEKTGKIVTDNNFETGIPGVFAAGDVRHGTFGRVGASVGEGQGAEHGVFEYFKRLKKDKEKKSLFPTHNAEGDVEKRKRLVNIDKLLDRLTELGEKADKEEDDNSREYVRKASESSTENTTMNKPVQMLLPIQNVFCPTGEGGGVDATCSPGGGGSEHRSDSHEAHKSHEAAEAAEIAHETVATVEEMSHHPILGPLSAITGVKLTNISKSLAESMSKSSKPPLNVIGDKWKSAIEKTDKFNDGIKEWAGERHGQATAAALSAVCAVAVARAEDISGVGLILKIIPGHKTACNLLGAGVGEVAHQLHLIGDTKVGKVVEKSVMGMVKAYQAVVKGVKAAVKPFSDAIGDVAGGGLVFSRRHGLAECGIIQVLTPQQN
jgi:thioredoxin reductase